MSETDRVATQVIIVVGFLFFTVLVARVFGPVTLRMVSHALLGVLFLCLWHFTRLK